jgi:DMSO reductase family type II enzyme heme b subunit
VLRLEELGKDPRTDETAASPNELYSPRCAACHGAAGAGDGPLAAELMPAPRSFTREHYRFRSTLPGSPPIFNDVLTILNRGMGNTAMGRMLAMGTQQMEDAGKFIEGFGSAHFLPDEQAILIGSPPNRTPIAELTARGRAVYDEQHCAECHGKDGRGDGPKAADLKDELGRPAIATNLTKRWHLKGGGGVQAVYRILSTGLDGTPMASYASSINEADRWAVGYFLDKQARQYPRFMPTVLAGTTKEKIPNDPTAAFWKTTPATTVPLGPQIEVPPYWTQPSVDAVDITVAVDDDQIGILLVWDDRTKNEQNDDAGAGASTVAAAVARYGAWRLPDQMAVQFIEKVDPKGVLPSHYLGASDRPVVRWIWSANRPEQALVERVAGPRATPVAVTDASVQTRAAYADGQWRVVLIGKRPPKTVAETDIALQGWDGSTGETGRWHGLSGWLDLKLR